MEFYNTFEKYNIPVLDLGVKLPKFKIEKRFIDKYKLPSNVDDYTFLETLAAQGLKSKIGEDHPQYLEYYTRMQNELDIFKELGFCSYLLITWDIVNYCRENDIPTGYGRGSAAGSIVLYLIDVTQIDSLKYGLYFERFLSKTRAKLKEVDGIKYYQGDLLMDIDLDISFSHRKQVTDWLEKKYQGRISKLLTVSTYTTKILIKEIVKTYLGYTETYANEISEYVPKIFGKVKSIDTAYEESDDFKKFADSHKEAIEIAKQLYEIPGHFGVHASAWIITADDINDIFPLQLTNDKEIVTGYSMDDALNLSIKCDILGLRCATLIHNVCKLIGIKPNDININDKLIYDNLQQLEYPHGLFQIEADCNYRVLRQVKPKSLEHLSAVVAIARPGALEFSDVFAEYVETGNFQSIHPFYDDILKDTAGIPIYQESLMRMANKVGFTLEESEILRRIVGKKKVDQMAEWEEKVNEKVNKNKLPKEVGEKLWSLLDASKDYSFNKAHSLSYAAMSAATIYLKFKYPKEFFLCLLNLAKDEPNPIEEIAIIQSEMVNFDIKLLGPHIIKSKTEFSIEGDNIRFALNSIKGISDKTLDKLRNFCHDYSNKFEIFEAANHCGIGIGILGGLISAGCLDDYLTQTRTQTVLEGQLFNVMTPREKKRALELGKEMNFDLIKIIQYLSKPQNGSDKPFIKEKRLNTLREDYRPYHEMYKINSQNEELNNYMAERQYLGYSYSKSLVDILNKFYKNVIVNISYAKTEVNDTKLTVCGEITELKSGTSKNKNKYIKCLINDGGGSMNLLLMEKHFEQNETFNNGHKLEVGDIIVATGRKSNDIIFCDRIVAQNIKIVNKISELV